MKKSNFKSKEALMDATLDEFSQINYENASLNRIIKNAGISKGTFYYHFKNKEELYKQLLKKSFHAKWKFINEYTTKNALDFSKMDIFEKFLYQAKAGIMFGNKYPKYSKLANMFVKEKDTPIYKAIILEISLNSNNILKNMIHEAYKAGEFDKSYSEEFIMKILIKLFSHYNDFFEYTKGSEDALKNLDEFVRFIKEGFKVK